MISLEERVTRVRCRDLRHQRLVRDARVLVPVLVAVLADARAEDDRVDPAHHGRVGADVLADAMRGHGEGEAAAMPKNCSFSLSCLWPKRLRPKTTRFQTGKRPAEEEPSGLRAHSQRSVEVPALGDRALDFGRARTRSRDEVLELPFEGVAHELHHGSIDHLELVGRSQCGRTRSARRGGRRLPSFPASSPSGAAHEVARSRRQAGAR